MNLLDKLMVCPVFHQHEHTLNPTFRGWSEFLGKELTLSHLKRFRGTKRLSGYVWFRLKRLSGTKFSDRRKTHGFIDKNHDV